jgi:hypothetical protein
MSNQRQNDALTERKADRTKKSATPVERVLGEERMFDLLGGQAGGHREPGLVDEKEQSITETIDKKGRVPGWEPARSKNSASQPRLAQPGHRPTAAPTTACSPEGRRRHAPAEGENRLDVVCQTAEHVAAGHVAA